MRPDASRQDRRNEALLAGHGEPGDAALQQVLVDVRLLGAGPVPQPSAALTALLTGATPLPTPEVGLSRPAGGRHRSRRSPLRAVVLSVLVGFSVLTASAAANALPREAQRTVAHVLNILTPFHFPSPPQQLPTPGGSTPGPVVSSVGPSASTSGAPSRSTAPLAPSGRSVSPPTAAPLIPAPPTAAPPAGGGAPVRPSAAPSEESSDGNAHPEDSPSPGDNGENGDRRDSEPSPADVGIEPAGGNNAAQDQQPS